MNENGFDPSLLIGLHKMAAHNGDGLVPELLERLQDRGTRERESAEIVKLPGLHERPVSRSQSIANGLRTASAPSGCDVIAFPLPRWHRNAERRGNS